MIRVRKSWYWFWYVLKRKEPVHLIGDCLIMSECFHIPSYTGEMCVSVFAGVSEQTGREGLESEAMEPRAGLYLTGKPVIFLPHFKFSDITLVA